MAIGTQICSCGHEQPISGKGVRGVYRSDSPCTACNIAVELVKFQRRNQHRLDDGMTWVPYTHLPSDLVEGERFSYSTRNMLVDCLIVSVVRQGAELGYYAPSCSVGGRTEYNHSRGRSTVKSPAKVTVTLSVTVKNDLEIVVASFKAVVVKEYGQNESVTMTEIP